MRGRKKHKRRLGGERGWGERTTPQATSARTETRDAAPAPDRMLSRLPETLNTLVFLESVCPSSCDENLRRPSSADQSGRCFSALSLSFSLARRSWSSLPSWPRPDKTENGDSLPSSAGHHTPVRDCATATTQRVGLPTVSGPPRRRPLPMNRQQGRPHRGGCSRCYRPAAVACRGKGVTAAAAAAVQQQWRAAASAAAPDPAQPLAAHLPPPALSHLQPQRR